MEYEIYRKCNLCNKPMSFMDKHFWIDDFSAVCEECVTECPTCEGTGKEGGSIPSDDCDRCAGTGFVPNTTKELK